MINKKLFPRPILRDYAVQGMVPLCAFLLVILLPGTPTSAFQGDQDSIDPSTADVSRIVQTACYGHLPPMDSIPDEVEVYARCALKTISDHGIFSAIMLGCPRNDQELEIGCPDYQDLEPRLLNQLWALVEACDAYPDSKGCNLEDHCDQCPTTTVGEWFRDACSRSCSEVVEVDHLGTTLNAGCTGQMELLEELPPSDGTFWGDVIAGVDNRFFWEINSTFIPPSDAIWEYNCTATPEIQGWGSGGFMRWLLLIGENSQGSLCRYDGFIEDHCVGSFTSTEVMKGNGTFSKAEGGRRPPSNATMEHEPGWQLENRGQGSTMAFAVLDPEPANVPGVLELIEVEWEINDDRDTTTQTAWSPAVPMIFLFTGILAMLGLWSRTRRGNLE